MELKTITNDCDLGRIVEEFKPLVDKTRDKLYKIAEEYAKECFDNNIETTSAMGMFYSLAMCAHATAVAKEMLSRTKKK